MTLNADAGAVIWITGYSAAGKTSVGRLVTRKLAESGLPALFLDGDQLRSIFANRWGYSREDRVELACTYFKLCSHLSKQGVIVVIAAVAMLEEAQRWFRDNVDNGFEVYLRVPLEERVLRDGTTKRIYARGISSMQDYTEPTSHAFTIDNFGDTTVESASERIVEGFRSRRGGKSVDYGRASHWSGFYRKQSRVPPPSPFALDCRARLREGERLLELGCGNGRDAFYFDDLGLRVTAIDRSPEAIEACRAAAAGRDIAFLRCDAAGVADEVAPGFDIVYSRFSLHAMTRAEEDGALDATHALLKRGGQLLVECRSINDPLSREGDVISPTERIAGHYRRFIVLEELRQKLLQRGFEVEEAIEAAGLARHGDEDPVVIRMAARKT
jgi:adenylylsulfate kinase-like enzyme/2-polyprenyl-3-methyl-5-hydroxy-6-metoxy-1,4-benzoquinol methylase